MAPPSLKNPERLRRHKDMFTSSHTNTHTCMCVTRRQQFMRGGMAQLVEPLNVKPGSTLTQVQVPGAARDFSSSQSQLSVADSFSLLEENSHRCNCYRPNILLGNTPCVLKKRSPHIHIFVFPTSSTSPHNFPTKNTFSQRYLHTAS